MLLEGDVLYGFMGHCTVGFYEEETKSSFKSCMSQLTMRLVIFLFPYHVYSVQKCEIKFKIKTSWVTTHCRSWPTIPYCFEINYFDSLSSSGDIMQKPIPVKANVWNGGNQNFLTAEELIDLNFSLPYIAKLIVKKNHKLCRFCAKKVHFIRWHLTKFEECEGG